MTHGHGPVTRAATAMADLRAAADLFGAVWGRNDEGVPIGSEMLRSLAHADGLVTLLEDDAGTLLGAAVLGRARPGSAYSYIAATAPGHGQQGLGGLLKQHQRAWCLERDIATLTWTFDPLVGRNARFNLTKLGAVVDTYEPDFYGVMSDQINGTDPADRLVARWTLADPGPRPEPPEPAMSGGGITGPDGQTAYVRTDGGRWVRVPSDIVALRRTDASEASAWRAATREWFTDAFGAGFAAVGVTRTGWYHLTPRKLS
ncbi:MAG: GNAT family N-acetyltransferase [Dermatophilaceae bacterium]